MRMGLRLQIVLALGGLMLLAFGPLFLAVASLTRASSLRVHQQGAATLVAVVGTEVTALARIHDDDGVRRAVEAAALLTDVEAVCFEQGDARVCAGSPGAFAEFDEAPRPGVRTTADGNRVAIDTAFVSEAGVLKARVRFDAGTGGERPLVRLVAFYTVATALALLLFAHFALTRLIVRPVESLAAAADRVAGGARTLRAPEVAARELAELGASMHAMTKKLVAEEAALKVKVLELTETATRLTRTQAQLVRSERLASVGRLAAGVAHEIGNPIAALTGLQDLMLDGPLAPEARDLMQRMRKETERIHRVLRDLLDFARPEGGAAGGDEGVAVADVRSVIDDACALVRVQRAFRGVDLHVEASGRLQVAMPPARLTQVILNLLMNAGSAVQSSGRGRGRVTARANDALEGRVRLEVEDDGPGVPSELGDSIFEPFVTTKGVGEGTGLGLAVCRGLVESAGGEIGLDRAYRDGARFYLVLRAVDDG
jgi:signal transduction histidine kinase